MATADAAAALERLQQLAASLTADIAGRPVVVGLSGGSDSTLLLALAAAVGQLQPAVPVRAVHCIHGLDNDDPFWLAHCRQLCARLQVPLTVKKLNIVYQNRISPEDSSRQERYRALLEECRGGVLWLGHQRDDQVESFFLAAKRGSGPQGLAGMKAVTVDQRGTIMRPLLPFSKAEIEQWLGELDLDFVFDISNSYLKFERNFLRLKVIPLLKTRFTHLDRALLRTQELCALEHDLAQRLVEQYFTARFDAKDFSLDTSGLDLQDQHLLLMLLRRFCREKLVLPPELALLRQALQLLQGTAGRAGLIELIPRRLYLRRFRHKLYLVDQLRLPGPGTVMLQPGKSLIWGDFLYSLQPAAADEPCAFALPPGQGVYLHFGAAASLQLQPAGRAHRRELGKLCSEYNVPQWWRPALPLISTAADCRDGAAVLAVAGVFAVKGSTVADRGSSCFVVRVVYRRQPRELLFAQTKRKAGTK